MKTYRLSPSKLLSARKTLQVLQGEIAEKVGLCKQNYNRLERNGGNPTIDLCMRIAKALRCPVESLVEEEK